MPVMRPTKIQMDMKPSAVGGDEVWRKILLSNEVLIRSVHDHKLVKNVDDMPASARKNTQEVSKKDGGDDSYDSEYETGWLCDASNKFKDGCKSG